MKAAILVLADPQSGSDESNARVFNALASAYDFKQRGSDVKILFQGAGTRWPSVLANKEHPSHDLYEQVKDKVDGVSCGCADAFGVSDEAEACGLELKTDLAVPGTSGLASVGNLVEDGYSVLSF